MKALLLAAGLGTRLSSISNGKPKPLMDIRGVPLLHILIQKLFSVGVEEIVINTHHLHEQIEEFIESQNYRNQIKLVYEKELLGTAGTLKANIDYLDDQDFFVLHGDNFFQDDLKAMIIAHKEISDKVAITMGTFEVENPANFGTVVVNSESIVTSFYEKDPKSPSLIANSAIYIMKPTVAKEIRNLEVNQIDISRNLIPQFMDRIFATPLMGVFLDIGTPENYLKANEIFS
jgi:mannose-1-phosphate guanylyltransferase